MCGRFSLSASDGGDLERRFGLTETLIVRPRYNICPTDDVLVVVADRERRPRAEAMRWGLVPHWAASPAVGARMINARAETIATSRAFSPSLRQRRCLVIADGFYEWQKAPTAGASATQPFHIARSDRAPFAFAGLWASWHDAARDATLHSCTIITRAAAPELAAIHPRQPIILDGPAAERAWLDPTLDERAHVGLLTGIAGDELAAHPVGTAVNNVRNDGPECLEPPAAPSQQTLFDA